MTKEELGKIVELEKKIKLACRNYKPQMTEANKQYLNIINNYISETGIFLYKMGFKKRD